MSIVERYKYVILGFIVVLSFLLRFVMLSEFPNGFHRDEAYLGYNAYSLLKTGKDMTGDFLPLNLSSFLYTPAGYSYLSILFIALFGLNEFSVRFASALFGVLAVVMIFYVAVEIFTMSGLKKREGVLLGLISSAFLAVTPWHIILSRTASVNTVVTFFILLGVLLFFKWVKKRTSSWLLFSFLSFGICLLFYIAPYSFVPLFIPLLIICFLKQIKKINQKILSLIFLLLIIPIVLTFTSDNLSLRAKSLSITNAPETVLGIEEQLRRDGEEGVYLFMSRVTHNKLTGYTETFLKNYFKHLSYDFFFTDSAFPDRYKVPHAGLLYPYYLPFFIAGLFFLLQRNKRMGLFLFGWILLTPIGSAFASDDIPNHQRTLFMLPAIILVTTFGLYSVGTKLRNHRLIYKSFSTLLILFFFTSLFFFIHQMIYHQSSYRPWYRQEGYRSLVREVNSRISEYKHAVITNRESAPTIFFLFYAQYNPSHFQEETRDSKMKDLDRINFSRYRFSEDECPAREEVKEGKTIQTFEKNILYVNSGLCKEESLNIQILKTINREDGSEVFRLVERKN